MEMLESGDNSFYMQLPSTPNYFDTGGSLKGKRCVGKHKHQPNSNGDSIQRQYSLEKLMKLINKVPL